MEATEIATVGSHACRSAASTDSRKWVSGSGREATARAVGMDLPSYFCILRSLFPDVFTPELQQ